MKERSVDLWLCVNMPGLLVSVGYRDSSLGILAAAAGLHSVPVFTLGPLGLLLSLHLNKSLHVATLMQSSLQLFQSSPSKM